MYEWVSEVYLSFTSPVHWYDLWGLQFVIKGFFNLRLREKAKSLAASLVGMSQDSLGQEDPETEQWTQWLHFHEFWTEVNPVIEDPTKPITSALLDRLVATGTDLLRFVSLELVPQLAEDIAIIQQKLQSKASCSHEDREEIVKSLRGLEGNSFNAGYPLEDMLRDEGTRDKRPAKSHGLVLLEDDAMDEGDEPVDTEIVEWLRD